MNPQLPDREVHIAGVVVHARPGWADAVAAGLARLPGTEIRASDAGRLVVVCEGGSGDEILDLVARMRDLPGVINVALAYQHAESAVAMEEIVHEPDTP